VLETYQLAQCTFSPQLSKGTARILARTSPGRQRSSSPGAASGCSAVLKLTSAVPLAMHTGERATCACAHALCCKRHCAYAGAEDAGERLHAVAEQRRQRLQAQLEREQQAVKELRSSYRARSPGRGAQVGTGIGRWQTGPDTRLPAETHSTLCTARTWHSTACCSFKCCTKTSTAPPYPCCAPGPAPVPGAPPGCPTSPAHRA
jgi:hypothetical protein